MYDPVQVTETYQERKPGFALFIPGLRWHQSEKKAFQFGFTGVVYDGEMWQIPIPMVQWYRTLRFTFSNLAFNNRGIRFSDLCKP
jgi:hypothetical protein